MEQFNISDSLKEKLAKAETMEEVVKACAEEGLEVTLEDLKAAQASDKEELNEEDLDNVAGGVRIAPLVIAGAVYVAWKTAQHIRSFYGRR